MATTRKTGASKKASAPKSAAKKPARPVAKPTRAAKPVKAAPRPQPKPAAKPAVKSAAKAPARPTHGKALPAKAAKPARPAPPAKAAAARPVPPTKPPVARGVPAKGAPTKGAPAKGAPGKGVPVKGAAGKVVPAKGAVGKGAVAAPAKPAKPIKIKLVPAPPPSVRPIGVLPPEAMAKTTAKSPRVTGPVRPLPQRPGVPARPTKESMSDKGLSEADLKHFEQRLLQERARIMKEMGHLESTVLKVNPRDSAGELSGYSFHMADAGTDSMEREKAFDIASKEGRLLMEIDAALGRLYRGEYGVCEASGKPISRARLEALPWARYTVEEQEKLEREQRAGRAPQQSE